MDPVTHTLTGVVAANALFRRRLGPEAVPLMMVAANLPDVDAFVHFNWDPAMIVLRRSFGHSLFAAPLWAAALARIFTWKYPVHSFKDAYVACLAGCAMHVFFDLVNSFGVRILWPFWPWRPELAMVFIIDLALTGLLAAPLVAGLVPALREKRELLARGSAALVAGYLLLCAASRAQASRLLERQAPGAAFAYVFPEPLGPHRWRGVTKSEAGYDLFLIHAWNGRVEARGSVLSADANPDVARAKEHPLAKSLLTFFKAPVWETGLAEGLPQVLVSDLRFTSLVLDRGRPFEFRFRVAPDGGVERLR